MRINTVSQQTFTGSWNYQTIMQTHNMDRLMQHEELIISAASKTSVTGAAAGVVGTVSQVDILTLTGVLIAIAGFGVNLFFQWRRDRREHKEHKARMAEIRNGARTDTTMPEDA